VWQVLSTGTSGREGASRGLKACRRQLAQRAGQPSEAGGLLVYFLAVPKPLAPSTWCCRQSSRGTRLHAPWPVPSCGGRPGRLRPAGRPWLPPLPRLPEPAAWSPPARLTLRCLLTQLPAPPPPPRKRFQHHWINPPHFSHRTPCRRCRCWRARAVRRRCSCCWQRAPIPTWRRPWG
jgi:hypothetical protein